jgi:hypothetical protein
MPPGLVSSVRIETLIKLCPVSGSQMEALEMMMGAQVKPGRLFRDGFELLLEPE